MSVAASVSAGNAQSDMRGTEVAGGVCLYKSPATGRRDCHASKCVPVSEPVAEYGDRSNAVGKRFGYLKTALGFGEHHVFHSIRKTVATLLEDAGVAENVAADIIGHEKPTMTYGLYSGGTSLKTKRAAIEKLSYA